MTRYIYGAGKYGKALGAYFLAQGLPLRGFLVSGVSGKARCLDLPVVSLADFCETEAVVYIAIGSRAAVRSMRLHLLEAGLPLGRVYDASGFIESNLLHQRHFCNLCGRSTDAFAPGGFDEELFRHHHVIGGGPRPEAVCPHCGSYDRERWAYYVLENHTEIFTRDCRVLHFAPEQHIAAAIREENPRCQYLTCDIMPGRAMWQVDMTDIPFADATFDYIIANHVLEHISDLPRAVRELCRVLKPDGRLLLSFPICTDMETLEDPSVQTPEGRLAAYGQEDHVRLFGKDFRERLEQLGLQVNVYSPTGGRLTPGDIQTLGFIPDDVVMICRK